MYILIDSYVNTLPLQSTLVESDTDCTYLVLNDDRFLPVGFISMFDFIINNVSPLPKSFNDVNLACVKLPTYYSITLDTNLYGFIHHLGHTRGKVWFRRDCPDACAERVERLDENGNIVRLDFYNRYGFIAYSDFYNEEKEAVSRSYYSADNKPILNYSYSTDTYCLLRDCQVLMTFSGIDELTSHILSLLHAAGERIIPTTFHQISLLKQEKLLDEQTDIILFQTGNDYRNYIEDSTVHRESQRIILMNNESTKKYASTISEPAHMIRYVNRKKRITPSGQHALTLTCSDKIEGLAELAQANPHITFHVAANTMVSQTLLSYERYGNVKIYPGVSFQKLLELFSISSFYLDINYYDEIFDSIVSAVVAPLLLMGFEDTLHNPDYILRACIFPKGAHHAFSDALYQLSTNHALYMDYLDRQSEENSKTLGKLKSLLTEGES